MDLLNDHEGSPGSRQTAEDVDTRQSQDLIFTHAGCNMIAALRKTSEIYHLAKFGQWVEY